MTPTPDACEANEGEARCTDAATIAVRTTAPSGLRTLVYWDPTDAPSKADRFCFKHGSKFMAEMVNTLGR